MGGYLNFKLEETIVELNLALELLQISYLGKGLVTDSMVVKEMGESEGVEVFNINLGFIRQRRIKAHFLKDRKPENYKDISDKYRRKEK